MKKYLINLILILKVTICLIFSSYSQSPEEIELIHKQEIQHIRGEYEKMRIRHDLRYKETFARYGHLSNFIIKSPEETISNIFTIYFVEQAFSLKHLDVKLQYNEVKEVDQFVLFTFTKPNSDSSYLHIDFYQDGYLIEKYHFEVEYHHYPGKFEYQEGKVTKFMNSEIVAEGTCLFTANRNNKGEFIYSIKVNDWEYKIFIIGEKDFYEFNYEDDE